MSLDVRVQQILQRWQEQQRRGRPAPPEELCKDYPELLDRVKQGIQELQDSVEVLASGVEETLAQKPPKSGAATLDIAQDPPAKVSNHGISVVAMPGRIGRYRVERLLGRGGFGLVYLAHDDQLQRHVAIKVPHAPLVADLTDADAYLTEARAVANLDHPHIVPVFDVGSTELCPCFVVSKYIDGIDLATRLTQALLPMHEAVDLVATVAEALHHAHTEGLVHRDIKPGNILLDRSGKAFVTDFGIALREQDVGKGPRFAGTPAYMSPEQARGEGHRVDGRSDVFSLGVVFYELLSGRKPFKADSQADLLEQITSVDARPPRQINDAIPKELERICLKALAKRAAERYLTARDMADDLRHFQSSAGAEWLAECRPWRDEGAVAEIPTRRLQPPATHFATPASPKIIPKGLRSFDAADADFFLELFPGPRDRDGLPEGIRFWKSRIEELDGAHTFSVGLIYGPSGCGKSSLMKAGLLPRLEKPVTVAYIEATSDGTEGGLLRDLRRQLPDLPSNFGLLDTLAGLRQGRFFEPGRKVLVVLDQFEQWLHAKCNEENTELVQALRHCDGGRVQCIVMVRDDFWMAATRFMARLEVDLVQGKNCAAVDLFDSLHGRKVLALFGRAYGRLPEHLDQLTRDQNSFLDQAVAGLAQEGKLISVRLALFAEMVKGKLWTPATLGEAGGTEGVGVAFLEETFAASGAPPQHRLHQKAAQAVLKALLPDAGTDIKGHMRSRLELLEASGYGSRPKDFNELLRILDSELRLITPTDPEGVEGGEWRVEGEEGNAWMVEGKEDGVWRVACGGLRVEGKVDGSKLQRAGSVAVRHESGGEMLSGDKDIPEGRNVRDDKPDPASGGIDPGQHRRGTGEGTHEGVPQLPQHRSGLADGGRDSFDAEPADRLAIPAGAGEPVGTVRPNQPNVNRPAQGPATKTQGLSPSTLHPPPATRYYQLTHDYLVPSLREWLTRKQKETRRGRAELLLVDRAAVWTARPENRLLPSLVQSVQIRLLTDKRSWTPPQRKMLRKAARVHLQRGLAAVLLLAAVVVGGLMVRDRVNEQRNANYADAMVKAVLSADTTKVPELVEGMADHRKWTDPLLRQELDRGTLNPRQQLHARLALLPVDAGQVEHLYARLLEAHPQELSVVRNALASHQADLIDKLWSTMNPGKLEEIHSPRRLRAGAALASYDPGSNQWAMSSAQIVDQLVQENPIHLGLWSEAYRPVKNALLASLGKYYRDRRPEAAAERSLAASLLADYAADNLHLLAELLLDADEKQFLVIFPVASDRNRVGRKEDTSPTTGQPSLSTELSSLSKLLIDEIEENLPADLAAADERREKLAKRQANAAVALFRLGRPELVWPLLKHGPDPRVRSYMIHRLAPLGADVTEILKRLEAEPDMTIRRALILSLGEFSDKQLSAAAPQDYRPRVWAQSEAVNESQFASAARQALLQKLQAIYRSDADAGLHAAVEWLLRQWNQDDWLQQQNKEWARARVKGEGWWVAGQADERAGLHVKKTQDPLPNAPHSPLVASHSPPRWYVNTEGQTMMAISGPVEFRMGSPETEISRNMDEFPHMRRISRTFAIASKPVTLAEYRKLTGTNYDLGEKWNQHLEVPVGGISWPMAAYYCNLLSKAENIPEEQWCFRSDAKNEATMLKENYLSLVGYRLPTEAEMEYAARAGAMTSRYFGEMEDLMDKYAWSIRNSGGKFHRIGLQKPNDFGLFDVLGNCLNWCMPGPPLPLGAESVTVEDLEVVGEDLTIVNSRPQKLRGSSYNSLASDARSACRITAVPGFPYSRNGFRLARTLSAGSKVPTPLAPGASRK